MTAELDNKSLKGVRVSEFNGGKRYIDGKHVIVKTNTYQAEGTVNNGIFCIKNLKKKI